MNIPTEFLRKSIIVLLFAVTLTPFLVTNTFFFPFITGKAFYFRFLVELAALLYAVLVLSEPKYRPKKSAIMFSFAAFIGVLAVADLFGINPVKSFWSNFERMEGLVSFLHLFAYFTILVSVFTRELWNRFLFAWVASGATTGLYALMQANGALAIDQSATRVDATLGNATYLAVYMLFSLFFLLVLWVRRAEGFGKRLFWFGIVLPHALMIAYGLKLYAKALSISGGQNVPLGTVLAAAPYKAAGVIVLYFAVSLAIHGAIRFFMRARDEKYLEWIYGTELVLLFSSILLATATRGAMLGLFVGAFVSAVLMFVREWRKPHHERHASFRLAAAVLAAIVIIPALFFAVRNTEFVRTNPILVRFANISLSEQTIQSRFILWGMAMDAWKEHPILGWGQENFNIVFNKYYEPSLWPQEQWFDRAHSVFFDALINAGILGLISYLGLFAAFLYVLWRRTGLTFAEKSVLTGLVTGYFIHNLAVFDNLVSQLVFVALLAWVHSESVPESHTSSREWPALTRDVGVAVALLVFLLVTYFVQVKPMLAARGLIQAIHAPGATPGDVSAHLAGFKRVIGLGTFGSPEAREQLVLFVLQNVLRANPPVEPALANEFFTYANAQMTEQAKAVPEDARYPFFGGILLLGSGNPGQAVPVFEKALSLSPDKQTMMFPLIEAHLISHNFDQAVAVAKKAFELAPAFREARLWYVSALITDGKITEGEKLITEEYGKSTVADERVLRAYKTIGRYEPIERTWKAEIAAAPNNTQNYFQLAQTYLEQKRTGEAITVLMNAAKVDPTLQTQIDSVIKEIRAGKTSL